MTALELNKRTRPAPGFFYGYIIVLITFTIAVLVDGLIFSFAIFFDPLLTEFGWTRAVISVSFSLTALMRIPIAIIAGTLSDRFGSKKVVVASGFFLGLGYILTSQVSTPWQLYLSYGVLAGIGISLYWVPLISLIPRWFVKRRALMMGVFTSGIGFGQLIIPPTVNWLIASYGWRTACLIIGIACIIVITAAAQFLRNSPKQMGMLPYGESSVKLEPPLLGSGAIPVREVIRMKRFWVFCLVYFSWFFYLSVIAVHIVVHAIGLGMSPSRAASVLIIIGITGIIGRLVSGRLADVLGMKPVLLTSFVFMFLASLSIIIGAEAWVIFLFAFLFGIAYGTFETMQSPIIAELFGLNSVGTVFGAALSVSTMGYIFGPIVAGYLFDITNSYQIAFIICALMALVSIAAVVILPISPRKKV